MSALLLRRARGGDEQAQHALVAATAGQLRRYLDRRMGQRLRRALSVADLSQEVFARVFRALPSMPDDADERTFRRWLYRHADWVLADHGNAARRHVGESGAGEEGPVSHAHTAGPVTRGDEARWLHALLRRLDPKYGDVVRLRLDGLSFAGIAERLGIREQAARQRHARVLHALREQYGDRREPGDDAAENDDATAR